jgi:hypothetical protein
MVPIISKKIKCNLPVFLSICNLVYEMDDENTVTMIGEISKTLMMDEFEIVNWIKFIDR